MSDEPDRAPVQLSIDRALLAEIDRLGTLWDLYRYEVLEEVLRLGLERVRKENYQPKPKTK